MKLCFISAERLTIIIHVCEGRDYKVRIWKVPREESRGWQKYRKAYPGLVKGHEQTINIFLHNTFLYYYNIGTIIILSYTIQYFLYILCIGSSSTYLVSSVSQT
uniref:Uncharacterized protein n=1 Tax=Cacopsylla melanoneura TaxID=428564 RepID=A0A8D8ZHN0_9HEMI